MGNNPIRIFLVDDHPVVREGMKSMIQAESDMVVVEEASNSMDVLKKINKIEYDVMLLDISLPGRDGLDILDQVKRIKPGVAVLILSMYPEEQFAVRSLSIGAAGYLTKESARSQLIHAIRLVAQGKKYISSSLAEKLALDLEFDTKKTPHEKLSNREYEVMCMLAGGKTQKEIASELSLSISTISTYRSRILDKMKLSSNADLASYALRHGLLM